MGKVVDLQDIAKTIEITIDNPVEISEETHLINDEIVDSLDSAVFLLEIEKLTDVKLTDKDVEERDLFKVANLIDFIRENAS